MKIPAIDQEKIVLGVDIGGTKIAVAAITTGGKILAQATEATLQEGPEAGIEQIIHLLELLSSTRGVDRQQIIGIGIGIPAVLENENDFVIWGPNLKGWKQVDLRRALEDHFELPVCIEYDGHTAVLGEWWQGAGQGRSSIVSVIIGTGVGGGMVLEGRLIRGVNRLAGAVGWFIMDQPAGGENTPERALGSWEAHIAGPGIASRAAQLLAAQPTTLSLLRHNGAQPTAADVFAAAQQGDALAKQITAEEARLLGQGLANIVSLANPEIIILGGSVGSHAGFLLEQVKRVIEQYAQPISAKSVEILASQLGTRAGLYGAAYGLMLRLQA